MKNLITIIIIILSSAIYSQECSTYKNKAFANNEFLKYKVYYNWKDVWLKAGSVSFEVKEEILDNEFVFHITAKGKTYPFYNWFYKVDDVYETFITKDLVAPKKFIRDVNEGGFKLDHLYTFDRKEMKVNTISKVNKHAEVIKGFRFNVCTQDMLSAIYYMRTIDFKNMKINEEKPVEVFLDNEFYDLSMIYKGKAIVDTKFGKVKCLKVQPKVISGRVFKDDESVIVYVTDDENKIPILIESPLSVGTIKAILEDYENNLSKISFID